MPNIQINIKNKVARADRAIIVCGNSDYTAVFDFDDEWDAYDTKTARFVYCGTYTDVVFTGNECPIPIIQDTRSLTIGVYAGDLHTTTPAYVSCVPSILCGNGIPADPTPDVYNQIMELLNNISLGGNPATAETLGLIKVGENLTITEDGVLSVDTATQVQPDWNQNDETAADYVKNRPFYMGDPVETVLVEESTVSFSDQGGIYAAAFPSTTFESTVGETYKVYWDGTAYECVCVDFNSYIAIGNISMAGEGSDTGEPFLMLVVTGSGIQIYTADTSASHTFSISGLVSEVVKIDEKYLPESSFTNAEWSNISNKIVDYKQQSLSLSASGEPITIIAGASYSKNRINDNLKFEDGMAYEINGNITLHNTIGENSCTLYVNGSYACSNGRVSFGYCYDNHFDKYIEVRLYSSSSSDDTFNYGKLVAVTTISGSTEYTFDINITVTAEARRLPDICIGENIQRVGDDVIIPSSTPDSTKKFRITVDDSGTITATEVS